MLSRDSCIRCLRDERDQNVAVLLHVGQVNVTVTKERRSEGARKQETMEPGEVLSSSGYTISG
jgi:hypothetical protein